MGLKINIDNFCHRDGLFCIFPIFFRRLDRFQSINLALYGGLPFDCPCPPPIGTRVAGLSGIYPYMWLFLLGSPGSYTICSILYGLPYRVCTFLYRGVAYCLMWHFAPYCVVGTTVALSTDREGEGKGRGIIAPTVLPFRNGSDLVTSMISRGYGIVLPFGSGFPVDFLWIIVENLVTP
jgi:hypothetical protein